MKKLRNSANFLVSITVLLSVTACAPDELSQTFEGTTGTELLIDAVEDANRWNCSEIEFDIANGFSELEEASEDAVPLLWYLRWC